jgi:hypothetical protein
MTTRIVAEVSDNEQDSPPPHKYKLFMVKYNERAAATFRRTLCCALRSRMDMAESSLYATCT